jgi:hypothetical protein
MLHSSVGVIHLDDSDADAEEVGSDVEEVVRWDHELRRTKTFSTGFLILSGRKFDSPNLEKQRKMLLNFIDQPAHDYFLSRSPQARAFEELKIVCKLGWKNQTSRKKKWNVRFVAEQLALLLVISTSGREGEGGTSLGRAIHPVCFKGGDQGHSSQACLPKALGSLRNASQALHTGGEGCGERCPSHSLTLSAVDRSTRPGSRSLGEMDEIRVELPCVHARLDDANAVT